VNAVDQHRHLAVLHDHGGSLPRPVHDEVGEREHLKVAEVADGNVRKVDLRARDRCLKLYETALIARGASRDPALQEEIPSYGAPQIT